MDTKTVEALARLVRYYSLVATTAAGSGHPTSCLSAADLMTMLLFGGFFKADLEHPDSQSNDRLIFSKGHAAPLLYSLYAAAGKLTEAQLRTLRQFGSELEGHPTPAFAYTEVATGSLGQGLSVGVGMALNAQMLDKTNYRTYVLLGDSEFAEGSNWEALELAHHYQLNTLVGILDVNRLGQRGETMYGHDVTNYAARVSAFGWQALVIDGHDIAQISEALTTAQTATTPVMIIAKTLKGKGVSFLEDQDGWHGTALSEEDCARAIAELGEVDTTLTAAIASPADTTPLAAPGVLQMPALGTYTEATSTRKAYGNALAALVAANPHVLALDAETSNSTYAEMVKKNTPAQFFEMYIAEQNMVGTAQGLASRHKKPFVSTFTAFFTRAHDQIRMGQYSESAVCYVGSHGGVSIGEDGGSQMGLEDLALFRSIHAMVVLYPADAVSTEALTQQMALHNGAAYMRTTRVTTPLLYSKETEFVIGGSHILRQSEHDQVTVVAAGITVHQALLAADQLATDGIVIRVIDLYSIKPIDAQTLQTAAAQTNAVVTVEDHYPEGGLGEAVTACLSTNRVPVYRLAVTKLPHSGTSEELLAYEQIDAAAIVRQVKEIVNKK